MVKFFLDGENITDLPMYKSERSEGIGYLAQEASVFRHLTVEENLMAVLEMSDLIQKSTKRKNGDVDGGV